MNHRKAVLAGMSGAAAMTLFAMVLRALDLTRLNLELLWGSLLTRSFSDGSWVVGLLVHMAMGAAIGLLYARVLERGGGWQRGLELGGFHAVVSGLFLPILAQLHPLVREQVLTRPGVFAMRTDWQVVLLFVVLHLAYGTVVGAYYPAPPAEPEVSPEPVLARPRALQEQLVHPRSPHS